MKKTRWIFFFIALIAVAGYYGWRTQTSQKTAAAAPPSGPSSVSVITTMVTERDVPIWLSGIGTVQAYNTVTVRPRVSGTLDQVNFTEGAMVKQGDVLAQIDPRPYRSTLAQAQAKKAQDEAQLNNARLELTRVKSLLKNNAVSQQVVDQSEATVAQLAALVQADQSAVEAAQLDLDFTTVRAPIAGRTGVRLVDAGNVVTQNQDGGLVVLTQLQPISVIFTLPQQHLPVLRKHMQPGAAQLVAQALTDDGAVLDEGRLELIDNQIDVSTGTLRLKATFPNKDYSLWPGQFVSARTLVETRKNAVIIPTEVVRPGLDFQFAYLVKPDNTVEARPIKPGISLDGFTIIEEGLKAGDKVVRDGQSKLKPGSKIKAQEEKPTPHLAKEDSP